MYTKDIEPKYRKHLTIVKAMVASYMKRFAMDALEDGQPERVVYAEPFCDKPVVDSTGQLESAPLYLRRLAEKYPVLRKNMWMVLNTQGHRADLTRAYDKVDQECSEPMCHKTNFLGGKRDAWAMNNFIRSQASRMKLCQDGVERNVAPTLLIYDAPDCDQIDMEVLSDFLCCYGNEMILFVDIERLYDMIAKDEELGKKLLMESWEECSNRLIKQAPQEPDNKQKIHILRELMDYLTAEIGRETPYPVFRAIGLAHRDSKNCMFMIHLTSNKKHAEFMQVCFEGMLNKQSDEEGRQA